MAGGRMAAAVHRRHRRGAPGQAVRHGAGSAREGAGRDDGIEQDGMNMDASRIQVAVVGGGTMGRDIAATFANAGARAHIVETFPQARAVIAERIG
ncbi:MAG: NAD-binding protein, partial [Burkholderiales bacterium]|nr:NAD-binding protein [Burkholderiales bacterium]